MTYNFLLPLNTWLLLNPSKLCCDWTMGSVPLVTHLLDIRNLATLAFYIILSRLCWIAVIGRSQTSKAILMVRHPQTTTCCLLSSFCPLSVFSASLSSCFRSFRRQTSYFRLVSSLLSVSSTFQAWASRFSSHSASICFSFDSSLL